MFPVYSFLYTVAIIVLSIPQYLKRPRELRRTWIREKLGMLPEMSSSFWVHAVSVGEVNAAVHLLTRIREKYPDIPVILSTITDTGRKVASEKVPEGVRVVYLPFDLIHILRRAFRRVHPRMLIILETELWPNIFRYAHGQNVPVIILNGRISEKSSRGYKKISFFMKKVFSFVSVFGMQSSLDAERLKAIGADENKVQVSGNFKFDRESSGEVPGWAAAFREGPVIIAGSTHKGEEELVLSAYLENLETFPDLKLILAPRHPERFREVSDLLNRMNVRFIRRSEMGATGESELHSSKVLLLDSVGELSSLYVIADIALIGKSFRGVGGQNPLEAAYWGKPIVCGPHMENFPFMKEFYAEEAAFEIDPHFLAEKIGVLLAHPEIAGKAGEKAKMLYESRSGAVEKAMKVIEAVMAKDSDV